MKCLKRLLAEWIWDSLIELLWPEIERALNEAYTRGYLTGENNALEVCKYKMDDIKVGGTD